MTIELTEEQRRERVMQLFAEIQASDKLVKEIDERIRGWRYRNPFPNKNVLRSRLKQILIDQALLIKKRNECLASIAEHQKQMKNPPIHITDSPPPDAEPNQTTGSVK